MMTTRRPAASGNHIARPVSRNTSADTAIVQKYAFCPPLKKPTDAGSTGSAFVTYARMLRSQRVSSDVHVIGRSQFKNCSANTTTNPRLNHGCRNRVSGPPPHSGVLQRYSHAE